MKFSTLFSSPFFPRKSFTPLEITRSKSKDKESKSLTGFTLVELLVIVAIIFILAVISFEAFRFFGRESALNNSAEEIINILRLAQNKTLASEGPSQYGVYFDNTASPHQYTLFKGESYAGRDPAFDEVYKPGKGVEISEINLSGGGKEIVFSRVSGGTDQSGNIKLRLLDDPSKTTVISVDSSGRVVFGQEVLPSVLPDPRDSRHTHFDYNNNVQNAFTLRLVFPDYPADNFDIDFQTFLNVDKTEFSWEGVVMVGQDGAKTEQRLKIHTHSLTAFTAQFCIHRPLSSNQSYNDKALNIFLDDQEFIRYAGDQRGTTTKGESIYVPEDPLWQ